LTVLHVLVNKAACRNQYQMPCTTAVCTDSPPAAGKLPANWP
jgi:hypothetical protein